MTQIIERIKCWLYGHKLTVVARAKDRDGTRWVRCDRCLRNYVIDTQTNAFLPMDFELYDLHEWIGPRGGKLSAYGQEAIGLDFDIAKLQRDIDDMIRGPDARGT